MSIGLKMLVLDDDPERHSVFDRSFTKADIDHAWSYWDAIALLSSTRYDVAYLDHDLGDFSSGNELLDGIDRPTDDDREDVPGQYLRDREFTGTDVACFIARELTSEFRPARIVVHSWNPDGARRMRAILAAAGIHSVYEPFSFHY